jgi:hypothetical protein
VCTVSFMVDLLGIGATPPFPSVPDAATLARVPAPKGYVG